MSDRQQLDPVEALDRFFTIVRDEAAENPAFANRLADALGSTIMFRGEDATSAVDPILLAEQGIEVFRESFLTFPAKDLKKIMKDFGLATTQDFKGKSKPPQLVELMWERASRKLYDLKPHSA